MKYSMITSNLLERERHIPAVLSRCSVSFRFRRKPIAKLTAVAAFRGATWGMILYTADSLADVDKYDERNWGGNAYEYALTLCLDAVIKL